GREPGNQAFDLVSLAAIREERCVLAAFDFDLGSLERTGAHARPSAAVDFDYATVVVLRAGREDGRTVSHIDGLRSELEAGWVWRGISVADHAPNLIDGGVAHLRWVRLDPRRADAVGGVPKSVHFNQSRIGDNAGEVVWQARVDSLVVCENDLP